MTDNTCDLCARIARAEHGENPFAVARTATGYVSLGDIQYHHGYTVFVAKRCVAELHELSSGERDAFLHEMALVAEAVFRAFRPRKLNYDLLRQWRSASALAPVPFPRHVDDPRPTGPVWKDPGFLEALEHGPDPERVAPLKPRLLRALASCGLTIERRFD